MKEATIEKNNVSWAREEFGDAMQDPAGAYLHRKLNGLGARSWPDQMMVGPKSLWFMEYKKPDGTVSDLQRLLIAALRRLGQRVYLCNNKLEGRKIIAHEMRYGRPPKGYRLDGSADLGGTP